MKNEKPIEIPLSLIPSLKNFAGVSSKGGTIDDFMQDIMQDHMELSIIASAPEQYELLPEVAKAICNARGTLANLYSIFRDIVNERTELIRISEQ